jgi:hypothetical protein
MFQSHCAWMPPWSGMQFYDCPRAYVRLHCCIPASGVPARRSGAATSEPVVASIPQRRVGRLPTSGVRSPTEVGAPLPPSGVLLVPVRIPVGAPPPLRDHRMDILRAVGRTGASRAPDTTDQYHHRTIVDGHCSHHR